MSDLNDKDKSSIFERIKSSSKLQALLVVIIAIITILIWLGYSNKNKTNDVAKTLSEQYVLDLENRLSNTLSSVEGAGKVSVVINVESGMETVLAMKTTITETESGIETVETPILVNGKTVVLKELYPRITGVIIVAEGAKSISVLSKIQQATVSLLDVGVDQIEILTMKQ